MLVVHELAKSFPLRRDVLGRVTQSVDAVRGVGFTVAPGETLALVGESGAGKSTVGRLVLRLIEPTSGQVELRGRDVRSLSGQELRRFRSQAAMIFQDPYTSLNPRLFVHYSVTEPLRAQGRGDARERRRRADDLLERVGLGPEHAERFPYELSGGQLQRVAIARALATDPELIVCDEPVSALDMSIRSQVINLLRDIQRERGISYLFVSHDLSLVRLVADRVAVMRAGQIVELRPTDELFSDPEHEYTRQLLSAIPASHPRNRSFRPRPRK